MVEKNKNRSAKWGLAPFKKSKGSNKCDGESLTEELVSQFKKLTTYLSDDESVYYSIITSIVSYIDLHSVFFFCFNT